MLTRGGRTGSAWRARTKTSRLTGVEPVARVARAGDPRPFMRPPSARTHFALVVATLSIPCSLAARAEAQRPPPIVTDFDGREATSTFEVTPEPPRFGAPVRDEDGEDGEDGEARSGRLRPGTGASRLRPPPIVTDFDGIDLYGDEDEPMPDEPTAGPALDEDPDASRALLRAELLAERRRAMARRRAESPNARLLASPFAPAARDEGSSDTARARGPRAIDRLELGLAEPNAPVTATSVHDDGIRTQVGVALDAFRESVGFRVRFEPAMGLTDEGGFVFPNAYLRAALAVSATYRTPLSGTPLAFMAGVALEHQSDYAIRRVAPFAQTNVVAFRAGLHWDAGGLHGLARLSARTHAYSHTHVREEVAGAQTGGLALDVVVRSGSAASAEGNIQLCGALHASYVAPHGPAVLEEAHLDLLAGACARDAVLGELSLSVAVELGNERRWDRSRQAEHVGVVLRWSL